MEAVNKEPVPNPSLNCVNALSLRDLTYMCVVIPAHKGKLHLNPCYVSLGVPIPAAIMALGEVYL